jgi:hypothetical protein
MHPLVEAEAAPVVSLVLAAAVSQAGSSGPGKATSIRYAVLVSGRNPSKEQIAVLGERNAPKLIKRAKDLKLIVLENEKWIVLVAPSAACPQSQAKFALFEAAGKKLPFRLRLGDVPASDRPSVEAILAPMLEGLPKAMSLDDVTIETEAKALIDFKSTGNGSKETLTQGIAAEERKPDDLPPIKIPSNLKGAKETRGLDDEPEQAISFSVNRSVTRPLLLRAVREAGTMYEAWFDKRWGKVEEEFRESLTNYFGKDPILAAIGITGCNDWDSLSPTAKQQMLGELRRKWQYQGMDESDIEAKLQAMKFTGARSYLMVRMKLTDTPRPQGVGTSIFASPLGPP